jgi:hypothetical protein
MRHAAGRTPPRPGTALPFLLALLLLGAACTGPRPASNLTPTLIPQPTADRTVDAVVRGRVTVGLTGTPGTPGTPDPRTTRPVVDAGQSNGATAVPRLTASLPTVGPASAVGLPTVGPANAVGLATAATGPSAATRTPTAATIRAAATEPAPVATRAPTAAPPRATAVPSVAPRQVAPTAAPPPTFGRAPGASGLVRP